MALTVRVANGFFLFTNKNGLSSVIVFKYLSRWTFVLGSKYTFLCFPPLPKTIHSYVVRSTSSIFSFTSSPTRTPLEIRKSIIATSLSSVQLSLNSSIVSALNAYLIFLIVLILCILLSGLFTT